MINELFLCFVTFVCHCHVKQIVLLNITTHNVFVCRSNNTEQGQHAVYPARSEMMKLYFVLSSVCQKKAFSSIILEVSDNTLYLYFF